LDEASPEVGSNPPERRWTGLPVVFCRHVFRLFVSRLPQYSHLALFAILGCWLRIRIEKSSVDGGFASKDTSVFPVLCGNVIGSFILGALTSAAAIDAGTRKVAIFPSTWTAVQQNDELILGIEVFIELS
jgi:hypothetical protein